MKSSLLFRRGKKERDKLCPEFGQDLSLSSIGRLRYTILRQTGLR